VPDKVTVVPDGPGAVTVSWRAVSSFTRYYIVYVDEGTTIWTVPKSATSFRVTALSPGAHRFAVASATAVRKSARSAWVTQEVL
jgi:hypothetical protein